MSGTASAITGPAGERGSGREPLRALVELVHCHVGGDLVAAEAAAELGGDSGREPGEAGTEPQAGGSDAHFRPVLLDAPHDGVGDVLGLTSADAERQRDPG